MRYYYTDQFAAAWMQHHFNMELEFIAESDGKLARWNRRWFHIADMYERYSGPIPRPTTHKPIIKKEKIYIHPDSLHLLEPQEGDVISPLSSMMGYYIIGQDIIADGRGGTKEHPMYMVLNTVKSIEARWGKNKIIQRNGIAFMWPEKRRIANANNTLKT